MKSDIKKILVICYHQEILNTLERILLKTPNYKPNVSSDIASTNSYLSENKFDAIILGSGIPENQEQKIERWVKNNTSSTAIIYHYGGGSGLLFNELESIFGN
ncbi:MAG: hypothetical protein M9958_03790 [Chitinophagales bacterium]|nr:hypothetical protein [Chitinophagales bacterium]